MQVNGDTSNEPNETFTLNLKNATGNATIADGHAVGTIVHDDRKHGHNLTLAHALPTHRTVTRRPPATVPGTGKPAISGKRGKAKSSARRA